MLIFGSSNYSTPQTVMMFGLDDFVVDYNVTYQLYIRVSSSASEYLNSFPVITINFINEDNDQAGLNVTVTDPSCSEPYYGFTAHFTLFITSMPKDAVLFSLVSSNPSHANPSSALAVITQDNW